MGSSPNDSINKNGSPLRAPKDILSSIIYKYGAKIQFLF